MQQTSPTPYPHTNRYHWRPSRWFWLLLLAGLVVRLVAAALAPHPGIADPNHYYNLASNLAQGRGFVIDYIWQYHNPPLDVTHPIDYWMPFAAVPPALMLTIFPDSLFAALMPSAIVGALLGVLAYAIAAIARTPEPVRLLSMLGVIFLPEYVLNAARTDTTLLYVLFVGLCTLSFYQGVRGYRWAWLLAGACAGLAHLTRQDGILLAPAMVLAVLLIWRFGGIRPSLVGLGLVVIGWVGVLAPWMWRNWDLYGVLLPSGASRTIFITHFVDQFSYGRTLDLQHYLNWGIANIVGNIVFQAMANIRTAYTLPDVLLPVTASVGLLTLLWQRDRDKLTLLALPLCMVLALFLFYSMVTPFHTQGGGFKKSYMLVLPFLSFAGAWALWTFIRRQRVALLFGVLMAGLMLANAFYLTWQDFTLARRFNQSVIDLKPVLDAAGDINGDGEIIVMTQDPYILNYHGYRALMIPSDPRDMILEAAYRYQVDYIILPAARPALDPLMQGDERDPRLRWMPATANYQLLAVLPPDNADS